MAEKEFFRDLYEEKPEYVMRRDPDSLEARQILIEVRTFKLPNLLSVLPASFSYQTVVEVGCATGELLAEFPPHPSAASQDVRRIGFDISPSNLAAARTRYPQIEFRGNAFDEIDLEADIIILSDVLEHVPDDVDLLKRASRVARLTLVNLPIEDNWLNRHRSYGPADVSGHLRRYTLRQGLELFERSELRVLNWTQRWVHESDCERHRRKLRQEILGRPYAGGALLNVAKTATSVLARNVRPFGRRLFASNLFASLAIACGR
jgi:SAM-dependent methyltransferase